MSASFFLDEPALLARADQLAESYRTAAPFPHAVIDDFLPSDVIDALIEEFPGTDDIRWDHYTDGGRTEKLATADESQLPTLTRHVFAALNSGAAIRFLERLTGIQGLVADPHLVGGGLHRIERGGHLDVHADFNRHPQLRLDRRINLLLYLNQDWDDEWEGHLELWPTDGAEAAVRIAPLANRVVVFNTTDGALHGHPAPLSCPPGMARCSMAFYYYSNGRPDDEVSLPHTTLYRSRTGELRPANAAEPPVPGSRPVLSARRLAGRIKRRLRRGR